MAAKYLLCGSCSSSDYSNPSEELKNVPESKTDESLEEWTPQDCVFANELLLDKILKFSMYDTQDKLNMQTAHTCKLINSTWLRRVNVALRRAQLPPVILNTSKNPNKIIRFVQAFAGCPASKILPFHLTISPSKGYCYYHEMEYTDKILHTAMKSFWRCGIGLVELTINCENALWDVSGEPLVFSPVPLNLPHLQKIKIQVELRKQRPLQNAWWLQNSLAVKENVTELLQQDISKGEEGFAGKAIKTVKMNILNGNMQALVQKILTASYNLKSFSIFSYTFVHPDHQSWGINLKYVELPESIEEMHLTSYSSLWALHVDDMLLEHSPLPNLTSLSLQIGLMGRFDLISKVERILCLLRHQLKRLDISNAERYTGGQILLQLPMMENLEELWCGLWVCDDPAEVYNILPVLFPALKRFTCFETSPFTLLGWMDEDEGVSFSVVDVNLQFSESHFVGDFQETGGLVLTKMRTLKWVFPNLAQLKVVITDYEEQACAIVMKYIFHQLTRLQVLEIHIKESEINQTAFYGLVLGVKAKEARAMQKLMCGVNVDYQLTASIVNLQELKKLHLSTPCADNSHPKWYVDTIIKRGISKMPNLVDFSFSGGLTLQAPEDIVHYLTPNQRVYKR